MCYTCTKRNCNRSYSNQSNQRAHSRKCGKRNIKIKCRYASFGCRYESIQSSNVKRHEATCRCSPNETAAPRFECGFLLPNGNTCPHRAHTKQNIKSHRLTHEEKIECPICKKKYKARTFAIHKCGSKVGRPRVFADIPEDITEEIRLECHEPERKDQSKQAFLKQIKQKLRSTVGEHQQACRQVLSKLKKPKASNRYYANRHCISKYANHMFACDSNPLRRKDCRHKYEVPQELEEYAKSSALHQVNHLSYDQIRAGLSKSNNGVLDKVLLFKTSDAVKKASKKGKRGIVVTRGVVLTGPDYEKKRKEILKEREKNKNKKNKKKKKKKKKKRQSPSPPCQIIDTNNIPPPILSNHPSQPIIPTLPTTSPSPQLLHFYEQATTDNSVRPSNSESVYSEPTDENDDMPIIAPGIARKKVNVIESDGESESNEDAPVISGRLPNQASIVCCDKNKNCGVITCSHCEQLFHIDCVVTIPGADTFICRECLNLSAPDEGKGHTHCGQIYPCLWIE